MSYRAKMHYPAPAGVERWTLCRLRYGSPEFTTDRAAVDCIACRRRLAVLFPPKQQYRGFVAIPSR